MSKAKELFGEGTVAIGQELQVSHLFATEGKVVHLIVTGVFEDLPPNSIVKPHFIGNIQALRGVISSDFDLYLNSKSFSHSAFDSYIKLKQASNLDVIFKVLNSDARFRDSGIDSWLEGTTIEPIVKRLDELHFDDKIEWESKGQGDRQSLIILICLIGFILLITSVNSVNLITARSIRRTKEIGLRKTFGGSPNLIAIQFIFESLITILTGFVFSFLLIILLLQNINQLIDGVFVLKDVFSSESIVLLHHCSSTIIFL
jgi:putative ABC transport system permease protein